MNSNYNANDRESILVYARNLLGKSLKNLNKNNNTRFSSKAKGQLGQMIEEEYFGYKVNSRQEADFKSAGLELKVSPLKQIKVNENSSDLRKKFGYSAKERIVLSIIDYNKLNSEDWSNNTLMSKCRNLLLMFYMYEKNVPKDELIFKIINEWTPSDIDMEVIQKDWENIQSKVKQGLAHEISEGDTMYLGACTKGSTAQKSKRKQPNSEIMASQRAFCYKRSYVDYIIEELLNKEQKTRDKVCKSLSNSGLMFDERIFNVFNRLINESLYNIIKKYSIIRERKAKNFIRLIIDDICVKEFGDKLDNFEEFKKSGIEIKTILLKPNGMPKESMSFEQINFCEIASEEWEMSEIRNRFENKKFLWVIFKSNVNFEKQSKLNLQDITLHKVMFWNMPINDLEGRMHNVWLDTVNKIRANKYDDFIKISDGEIAHIRPKGKNSKDTMLTPQGEYKRKKCFWLNAKYIKEQIEMAKKH